MIPAADARFMAVALSLGRRGLGRVWPNPAVGCVIVQDGRIVGRGVTGAGGRPHAEVVALAQAGAAARGATAYVTLEPCSHHGETPPCAEALIAAGLARVVVACEDPDVRVSGRGIALLRAAKIDVEQGVMEDVARRDHAGFLLNRTAGRPFVTLKLALSLDGRIATAAGDSQWITGPDARRVVHGMRLRHDAVLVGGGTARADDPGLDVRGFGPVPQPVRIVASRALTLPKDGKLARSAKEVPLWLCHGAGADVGPWQALGARTVEVPVDGAGVDLVAMMQALGEAGLTRVFCEGGGQLAASLLRGGLVDELVIFSGGVAIGGDGRAGLGDLGLEALRDAPRFDRVEVRCVGGDVMSVWRPV